MIDAYDLASQLLQLIKDGFDAAAVVLPETAYVSPGSTVAFDGPQITINLTRIGYGTPGADEGFVPPYADVYYAELQVVIVRDTPGLDDGGNPPSVSSLLASAKENMADVVTLSDVLREIRSACKPGGDGLYDSPWMFFATTAVPVGPEGGVAAAVATVQAAL